MDTVCVCVKVDTLQQSDEFADITAVGLTAQRKNDDFRRQRNTI